MPDLTRYTKQPVFTITFHQDGMPDESFSGSWDEIQAYASILNYQEISLSVQFYGLPIIKWDHDYGRWCIWLEHTRKFLHDVEEPLLRWTYNHTGGYWTIDPIPDKKQE